MPLGCRRSRKRHADDAAVSGDQGGQSGLPAVLPDGRFLRAVLPGRRDREPRARHRADQARQAPRRRHPDVRRAGGALGRVSAQADRGGLPRRGVRADSRTRRRRRSAAQRASCARDVIAADHAPARSPKTRCSMRGATIISRRSCARAPPRPTRRPLFALAYLDISTGEFRVDRVRPRSRSPPRSRGIEPGEIIVSDALYGDAELAPYLRTLPR